MSTNATAVAASSPNPSCELCGGSVHLSVREGAWGPIVTNRCQSCRRVREPYEGQGARDAIFAARSRASGTA